MGAKGLQSEGLGANRQLLGSIIAAQEEERRRIARELHDETAQTLTALRLVLERLQIASGRGALKNQLAQPLALCSQAEDEVDRLIFALRPAILDDLGLVEAIRSHAESHLEAAGITLNFLMEGESRKISRDAEMALFRVTQEAINNTIKHAAAHKVTICLHFGRHEVVATIEDDGCGFNPTARPAASNLRHGLGLLGMKERLGLVGGNLSIRSRPGAGARLDATVPLVGEFP